MSQTEESVEDQTVVTRTRRFWCSLWDGRKWRGEADSKRIDITSALVGLIVSAGIIGFWLPVSLNASALDRDNVQRCWDAAIDVQKNVNTVEDGFAIQPTSPIPRRTDLRNEQIALRNAQFACARVARAADLQDRIEPLAESATALMARSDNGDFRNSKDFAATGFVVDVGKWVDELLHRLSS